MKLLPLLILLTLFSAVHMGRVGDIFKRVGRWFWGLILGLLRLSPTTVEEPRIAQQPTDSPDGSDESTLVNPSSHGSVQESVEDFDYGSEEEAIIRQDAERRQEERRIEEEERIRQEAIDAEMRAAVEPSIVEDQTNSPEDLESEEEIVEGEGTRRPTFNRGLLKVAVGQRFNTYACATFVRSQTGQRRMLSLYPPTEYVYPKYLSLETNDLIEITLETEAEKFINGLVLITLPSSARIDPNYKILPYRILKPDEIGIESNLPSEGRILVDDMFFNCRIIDKGSNRVQVDYTGVSPLRTPRGPPFPPGTPLIGKVGDHYNTLVGLYNHTIERKIDIFILTAVIPSNEAIDRQTRL